MTRPSRNRLLIVAAVVAMGLGIDPQSAEACGYSPLSSAASGDKLSDVASQVWRTGANHNLQSFATTSCTGSGNIEDTYLWRAYAATATIDVVHPEWTNFLQARVDEIGFEPRACLADCVRDGNDCDMWLPAATLCATDVLERAAILIHEAAESRTAHIATGCGNAAHCDQYWGDGGANEMEVRFLVDASRSSLPPYLIRVARERANDILNNGFVEHPGFNLSDHGELVQDHFDRFYQSGDRSASLEALYSTDPDDSRTYGITGFGVTHVGDELFAPVEECGDSHCRSQVDSIDVSVLKVTRREIRTDGSLGPEHSVYRGRESYLQRLRGLGKVEITLYLNGATQHISDEVRVPAGHFATGFRHSRAYNDADYNPREEPMVRPIIGLFSQRFDTATGELAGDDDFTARYVACTKRWCGGYQGYRQHVAINAPRYQLLTGIGVGVWGTRLLDGYYLSGEDGIQYRDVRDFRSLAYAADFSLPSPHYTAYAGNTELNAWTVDAATGLPADGDRLDNLRCPSGSHAAGIMTERGSEQDGDRTMVGLSLLCTNGDGRFLVVRPGFYSPSANRALTLQGELTQPHDIADLRSSDITPGTRFTLCYGSERVEAVDIRSDDHVMAVESITCRNTNGALRHVTAQDSDGERGYPTRLRCASNGLSRRGVDGLYVRSDNQGIVGMGLHCEER